LRYIGWTEGPEANIVASILIASAISSIVFFFRLSEFFYYPLLARLDIGAGVEQPFGCLIVQNRQAMWSVGRSMDWTVEDDMVDGLLCATLTGRRGCHTPFVQAGAETSDTGAKVVEPDPVSSWEGHFRKCVCLELKCRVLWGCPPSPCSIDDPPTALHVCCCCHKN